MQIVDSIHKPKYHIRTPVKYSHCNCLRGPASEVASIEDTRNILEEKHAMPINLHGTVRKVGDGRTLTVLNVQRKRRVLICTAKVLQMMTSHLL